MSKIWSYGENSKNIILNEPPKQRLRITGHRISSVLGLNKYQSDFAAWCEITKLVKLPFEDNKYTIAGKAIEPKLIEYVSDRFPNIMSIEDYYGNNIEKYKWNNFIEDSDIFGGIIDAVSTKNDKKTITLVVECKTSSKPQDWENNHVPIDYLLQGCEYSHLKKLDKVLFIVSFLQDDDYNHPEMFVPNDKNTKLVLKKISDVIIEMPNGDMITFEEAIKYCEDWWKKYIETGISPEFDEIKDKEYLDIIRASRPVNDSSLDDICTSALELEKEIEELKKSSGIDSKEKELKILKESIKESLMSQMTEQDNKIMYSEFKVTKNIKKKFNESKFKEEHKATYEKYLDETTEYRLGKLTAAERGDTNEK